MKAGPVPLTAGIPFAARSHILVADDALGRDGGIGLHQAAAEAGSLAVLGIGERVLLIADHLDADGVVVAALASLPAGNAGMPGAALHRHELSDVACPVDDEVGGDAHPFQFGQRRFRFGIEPAEKKGLDRLRLEMAGGQADGVQHDHIDAGRVGSVIIVGRWRKSNPAHGINLLSKRQGVIRSLWGWTFVPTVLHMSGLNSPLLIWLSSLLFAVIHSGMASMRCKQWLYGKGVSAHRYRLFYTVVAVGLTALWLGFVRTLPDTQLYSVSGWPILLLIGLQLTGLAVALWSFKAFDARMFLGLAAMPQGDDPFHEKGIYRYIRHPMYSGVMLALWASPVQGINSINLFACITLYFIIGSRLEEARMLAAHPAYAGYRRRVGAFIPHIRRQV